MFYIMFVVYLILNFYIYKRTTDILKLFDSKSKLIKIIPAVLIGTISILAISTFAIKLNESFLFLKTIGNTYLGLFVYLLIIFLTSDIIRIFIKLFRLDKKLLTKRNKIISGILQICTAIIIITYGVFNANTFKIERYTIDIEKELINQKEYKIALISDIHIGINIKPNYLEEVVSNINSENPDIILIAGDILDNSRDEVEDINDYINVLSKLKSKYGVYGVLGNHDTFTSNTDEVKELFNKMNIQTLINENVIINDEINLIGKSSDRIIPTEDAINTVSATNTNNPTILMLHEPTYIKEYFNKNIDLIVGGHTHNGQIFPGNIICYLIYYNSYGLKTHNNTNTIISSGIGLWGPKLRIGSNHEIVYITLK